MIKYWLCNILLHFFTIKTNCSTQKVYRVLLLQGIYLISCHYFKYLIIRNFSFLEELRYEFTKKFSRYKISRSNAFGMEKTFTQEISSLMHFYNTHPNEGLSSEKSAEIMTAKVDDLKSVLGSNIRLMLKRESNIEALMQKTEQMKIEANIFTKNTQLARKKVEMK